MRIIKSISVLLVATTISVKAQASPTARFSSFCELLQNKIYCYGGSQGVPGAEIIDSTMFQLDISQANKSSMTDLQNNWKVITPNTAGVNTEKRQYCQYGVVGGTQLLLSAGFGGANLLTPIIDQTIAFDSVSNSWKSYPNYIEGPFGNRQIFWASTADVPSKGLAFYGGFESHINHSWTIPTNQNLTATEFNTGYSRVIGYTSITYLDITNAINPWSTPPQTNAPSIFSAYQSSIFDPTSKRIYHFGGTYEDTLQPGYAPLAYKTWHSLSYSLSFDTVSGSWGNQSLGGTIPSQRRFHTTTLLPNGQSTVLLYGGEQKQTNTFVTNRDYCFTLDLNTLIWTQQNINAASVDLLRARHSVVVANNNTLFIINGLNDVYVIANAPIVLNISIPASITYLETYTDPNAPSIPNNGAQSQIDSTNGGLSTGAIAGIAVGAAVVGVLVIGAIIFWLRKKKQLAQKAQSIDVNWDEIEKQFMEMPDRNGYPKAPVTRNTDPMALGETTGVGSVCPKSTKVQCPDVIVPDAISHKSTTVQNPNAIDHKSTTVQYPDAIDEIHRQKPEGGLFW